MHGDELSKPIYLAKKKIDVFFFFFFFFFFLSRISLIFKTQTYKYTALNMCIICTYFHLTDLVKSF